MYFYAQLDEENVCCGVSQLSGEVIADNMVRLYSMDTTVIGKKYEDGEWVEVPMPEPVDPEPTQLDRMEDKIDTLVNGTTSENTEAINAFLGV